MYVFGQKIIINKKLKRTGRRDKSWIEIDIREIEVRVIGIRTLSNGRMYYDEGANYEPAEYFKAALVVEKLSRNPFYIKIHE